MHEILNCYTLSLINESNKWHDLSAAIESGYNPSSANIAMFVADLCTHLCCKNKKGGIYALQNHIEERQTTQWSTWVKFNIVTKILHQPAIIHNVK
jgi:hypothetical protein